MLKSGWCFLCLAWFILLSTILKLQCKLFSVGYDGWHLRGTINPPPEITIGKEIVTDHGNEVGAPISETELLLRGSNHPYLSKSR